MRCLVLGYWRDIFKDNFLKKKIVINKEVKFEFYFKDKMGFRFKGILS